MGILMISSHLHSEVGGQAVALFLLHCRFIAAVMVYDSCVTLRAFLYERSNCWPASKKVALVANACARS
jgi:hypothetical protein